MILAKTHSRQTLTFLPSQIFDFFENKSPVSIVLVFIIGNGIVNALSNTGAFEVFINNELVYSKIKLGSIITFQDLIRLIEKSGIKLIRS